MPSEFRPAMPVPDTIETKVWRALGVSDDTIRQWMERRQAAFADLEAKRGGDVLAGAMSNAQPSSDQLLTEDPAVRAQQGGVATAADVAGGATHALEALAMLAGGAKFAGGGKVGGGAPLAWSPQFGRPVDAETQFKQESGRKLIPGAGGASKEEMAFEKQASGGKAAESRTPPGTRVRPTYRAPRPAVQESEAVETKAASKPKKSRLSDKPKEGYSKEGRDFEIERSTSSPWDQFTQKFSDIGTDESTSSQISDYKPSKWDYDTSMSAGTRSDSDSKGKAFNPAPKKIPMVKPVEEVGPKLAGTVDERIAQREASREARQIAEKNLPSMSIREKASRGLLGDKLAKEFWAGAIKSGANRGEWNQINSVDTGIPPSERDLFHSSFSKDEGHAAPSQKKLNNIATQIKRLTGRPASDWANVPFEDMPEDLQGLIKRETAEWIRSREKSGSRRYGGDKSTFSKGATTADLATSARGDNWGVEVATREGMKGQGAERYQAHFKKGDKKLYEMDVPVSVLKDQIAHQMETLGKPTVDRSLPIFQDIVQRGRLELKDTPPLAFPEDTAPPKLKSGPKTPPSFVDTSEVPEYHTRSSRPIEGYDTKKPREQGRLEAIRAQQRAVATESIPVEGTGYERKTEEQLDSNLKRGLKHPPQDNIIMSTTTPRPVEDMFNMSELDHNLEILRDRVGKVSEKNKQMRMARRVDAIEGDRTELLRGIQERLALRDERRNLSKLEAVINRGRRDAEIAKLQEKRDALVKELKASLGEAGVETWERVKNAPQEPNLARGVNKGVVLPKPDYRTNELPSDKPLLGGDRTRNRLIRDGEGNIVEAPAVDGVVPQEHPLHFPGSNNQSYRDAILKLMERDLGVEGGGKRHGTPVEKSGVLGFSGGGYRFFRDTPDGTFRVLDPFPGADVDSYALHHKPTLPLMPKTGDQSTEDAKTARPFKGENPPLSRLEKLRRQTSTVPSPKTLVEFLVRLFRNRIEPEETRGVGPHYSKQDAIVYRNYKK